MQAEGADDVIPSVSNETNEVNTNQESSTMEKKFGSGMPPPKGVGYRVEYRHTPTDEVVYSRKTERLDFEAVDAHGDVFDIVTTFLTSDREFKPDNDPTGLTTRTAPLVTDSRRKVDMHLRSQGIIHALRSIVKYYPGQDLMGQTVIIPAPYAILIHHEKELNDYKERCHPSLLQEPFCPKETKVYEEIDLLQQFLRETVMPQVELERQRNARGLETFDMLWLARKPGTTFKMSSISATLPTEQEEWTVGVVETVKGGTMGFGGHAWVISYWSMDYDGVYLGTLKDSYFEDVFEGERTISSLDVIPDAAFQEPLDKSASDFVEQGRKCYKLLSKKCQYYKGITYDFPHQQIDSLVMIDMKKYYSDVDTMNYKKTRPDVSFSRPEKPWITDCLCVVCCRRKEEDAASKSTSDAFSDYHGISPDLTAELTAHMAFLLPQKVWGFVFKTRTWEQLYVKSLREPTFHQDMIDNLVMDPTRVKMLKALAGSYIRQNVHGEESKGVPWNADFIQGKGQGQIILLHGKPGVGKTCTAECIAEYTKRPLMVLTSSDIGSNPEKIEKVLSDGFKTASNWGAVLLIDEADVFMERRSSNDLNRNCLVAGFLRALEFYDGILFLTTNRVGAFDDAFISRIHVKLYYPDFTDKERQKIWQNFIEKLIKERGSSSGASIRFRVTIDAKEFIKGRELRELKWNGREIRNAFQTAVALAEYDAGKDEEGNILLSDSHLRSIVDMSRDFKRYLDETHGADEEKRAHTEHTRYDDRDERSNTET